MTHIVLAALNSYTRAGRDVADIAEMEGVANRRDPMAQLHAVNHWEEFVSIVQGTEPDCWHSSHNRCRSPNADQASGGEVAGVMLHEAGSISMGELEEARICRVLAANLLHNFE